MTGGGGYPHQAVPTQYPYSGIATGQTVAAHVPDQRPFAVIAAEQALADPVVREAIKQQAAHIGGHAMVAARHYGHQGLMAFQDYVQQGPQGVSTLCFVGGLATSILGFMNICNVFGTIVDPIHYILNAYMFAFGLATAVIEADTDRIGMLVTPFDRLAEPVTRAQAWLHEECKLLTQLRGRGLFYFYQGTLMVTQCVFCLIFLCGLYNVGIGVLCIMMSFGYTPDIEGMALSAGLADYAHLDSLEGQADLTSNSFMSASGFSQAQAVYKNNKEQMPGKLCRELWALQQQATVGDCNISKPAGMFNGSGKEQWRLWNGLRGISKEEAKVMFIERLRRDNSSA
mmetsp:Transcript_25294/g.57479  ORF Transcript_25294/g.57479 Transcript_25294/m.57479 type:complete len:342 (-) Transcript_25294:141-1166(-)